MAVAPLGSGVLRDSLGHRLQSIIPQGSGFCQTPRGGGDERWTFR